MYPLKMQPVFKDYLWGGTRLINEFSKQTDIRPVAESWEFSVHPDGLCLISNGKYKGMSLKSVLEENPEFLGNCNEFPVLIKFIDALESLSMQVHPDDKYAYTVEQDFGKNEMWYVLDAEPDAKIVVGFKKELTKEQLRKQIKDSSFVDSVNFIPVKKGDCFEIPSGMLHAIGKGVFIVEVQQSSNITYRVFDYNRRDKYGNLRKLHVDKAIDVIDTSITTKNIGNNAKIKKDGHCVMPLTNWEWFKSQKIDIISQAELNSLNSFNAIVIIDGNLSIFTNTDSVKVSKGDSVFIPANTHYKIKGNGTVLNTYI